VPARKAPVRARRRAAGARSGTPAGARYSENILDSAKLDHELRLILREEVTFGKNVEIEFERVMQVVFAE